MSLSDFEIRKITEIVAGKVGGKLDAKELRKVIDSVVDNLQNNQANPEIQGATCQVSASSDSIEDKKEAPASKTDADDVIKNEAGLYQQIEQATAKRIIIAAFGKDRPGVVATITEILAELSCSIEDISQTLMQEFFSMIMVVNINDAKVDFAALRDRLKDTETKLGMKVYVMHEDIFEYMHRI